MTAGATDAQARDAVRGAHAVPTGVLGVSVVTPTHGRVELVGRMLGSLAEARARASVAAEVVIVDSSEGEEAEAIRGACEGAGAVYVRHEENNVRRKRNLGVERARYPVVLFVDSDCEASPGLIEEHARGYAEEVGGVVGVTRFVGKKSWVWGLIERTSVLDSFSRAEGTESAPWGPTCNISYRREVLQSVGLFDTSFPFRLGGDDVDLGLRVTDSGHPIKCNPRAEVFHTRDTWSSLPLISRRLFRWGRMHYHLMLKHPQRRIDDFPKTPGVFLLLTLSMLLPVSAQMRPSLMLLPVIWLAASLALETVTSCWLAGRWSDCGRLVGARMLGLIFETGTLLEGLKNLSVEPLYKEIYYAQPSPRSPGRSRRVIQLWACVLSLIALLPLCIWL